MKHMQNPDHRHVDQSQTSRYIRAWPTHRNSPNCGTSRTANSNSNVVGTDLLRNFSALPSGLSPHFASSTNVTPTVTQYPRVDCRCCYTGYRLRRASTMTMDVKTPLSHKFPLDTSTKQLRENFTFSLADGDHKSGMSCALAMDHEQQGRQLFQRLPSIEDNR